MVRERGTGVYRHLIVMASSSTTTTTTTTTTSTTTTTTTTTATSIDKASQVPGVHYGDLPFGAKTSLPLVPKSRLISGR